MKTCSRCGEMKPADMFGKMTKARDGLRPDCRSCVARWNADYNARNRAKNSERQAAYRRNNAEVVKARKADYRARNAYKISAKKAAEYAANADAIKARVAANRANNAERVREYTARSQATYRRKNMARYAHYSAARRARIMQQTITLTEDQEAKVATFYNEAAHLTRETGIPHEVDHIVPLAGRLVCGLHVPWNLEVKTASANRKKSNRFEAA